nr:MAG TPA: hypothetical protein [Caudoviricetes sp.]
MITQTRSAGFKIFKVDTYAGRSIDAKPINNVKNGSLFKEIDTGRKYCFDAENKKWYEMPVEGF